MILKIEYYDIFTSILLALYVAKESGKNPSEIIDLLNKD